MDGSSRRVHPLAPSPHQISGGDFAILVNMKLLQLNVWGGRLEKQLIQLIKKENPDILCLQGAIDIRGGKSAMFASTEEMQEAIGAKHIFFSPVFTFKYMKRQADFGNCIISKHPIVSQHATFTGREYIPDFDWLEHDPNMRNFQHVSIKLGDTPLNVLNHHGHHIDAHKNGDEETMRQCRMIADYAEQLEGPIILAGDFNLAPSSKSLGQISAVFKNLSAEYKLTTTRTALTSKIEVCDYVFVNDQIKVTEFKNLEDVASDHRALTLDFETA